LVILWTNILKKHSPLSVDGCIKEVMILRKVIVLWPTTSKL
jgi:hypothetical protein